MRRSGTSRIKSTNPQSAADRSGQYARPMAMESWTSVDGGTRTSDAEDRSPLTLWICWRSRRPPPHWPIPAAGEPRIVSVIRKGAAHNSVATPAAPEGLVSLKRSVATGQATGHHKPSPSRWENVAGWTTLVPPEGFEPSTSRFLASHLRRTYSSRTTWLRSQKTEAACRDFPPRSSQRASRPSQPLQAAPRRRGVRFGVRS